MKVTNESKIVCLQLDLICLAVYLIIPNTYISSFSTSHTFTLHSPPLSPSHLDHLTHQLMCLEVTDIRCLPEQISNLISTT